MGNDFWIKRAAKYGRYVKTYTDRKLFKIMMKEIEKEFKRLNKATVLDLCCGTGLSSVFLRDKTKEIYYLDRSIEMINEGISKGIIPATGKIILHDLNVFPLPIKSNKFDIVISRYCVHDIKDKISLFSEIFRITKKNGIFILIDMFALEKFTKEFYNIVHGWKTTLNEWIQVFIENIDDYEDFLTHAGFIIKNIYLYRSIVKTKDWKKEGQITEERRKFIEKLVRQYMNKYNIIKDFFRIKNLKINRCIEISFPVVIFILKKGGSKSDEKKSH